MASSFLRFIDHTHTHTHTHTQRRIAVGRTFLDEWSALDHTNTHTQRRITVGRTFLDEWSARHRDHYLTTHNTQNIQTSVPPVGFEPTISAGERPQTYALDGAATGTGWITHYIFQLLRLEHSSVWCWNLDAPGNRSETPGKFWNVVLEKDGEDQLDRSCEKWRSVT